MIPITLSPPHEKGAFPTEKLKGEKMLFSEFLLLI